MNNTTNNEISEETIAEIVSAAQNIATDSTAMRQSMVAIADVLQPAIMQAGIKFGSLEKDDLWSVGGNFNMVTKRLGIQKVSEKWTLGIEETQLFPKYWDGSRWCGYEDLFTPAPETAYLVASKTFAQATRDDIAEAAIRLPGFVDAYCEELERRHIRYADLRKKATAMKLVVNG